MKAFRYVLLVVAVVMLSAVCSGCEVIKDTRLITDSDYRTAVNSAKYYLNTYPVCSYMSRAEFIEVVNQDPKVSHDYAVTAVDSLGIDWDYHAYLRAVTLLPQSFPAHNIYEQMVFSLEEFHFTEAQAENGVVKAFIDYGYGDSLSFTTNERDSYMCAKVYQTANHVHWSRSQYIQNVSMTMYKTKDREEVAFAVDHLGLDWKDEAYQAAKGLLIGMKEMGMPDLNELTDWLLKQEFTQEEAQIGALKAYSEVAHS